MKDPRLRPWLLCLVGVAYVLVAAISVRMAVRWYATPVAGVLLDPGGVVSNFGFSSDDPRRAGLGFPDRVLSADGQSLASREGTSPGELWNHTVADAARAGRSSVRARVATRAGIRDVQIPLSQLSPPYWWLYAGSCLLAGLLHALAALVALWASPHSALARTFGKVGLSTALLIGLTFDFHTSRALVPVFLAGMSMVPVSWFALALRLPDDAPLLKRLPWLERATDCIGVGVAALFVTLYLRDGPTRELQQIWTSVCGVCVLLFGAIFVVRLVRANGVRRDRMRALLIAALASHAVAFGIWFGLSPGGDLQAALYATLPLFPLATAYAFIRHDLWGSRALLSRIITRLLVGTVIAAVAVVLGTAGAIHLGVPFESALIGVCFGAATAPVLLYVALGALDRFVFESRVHYKPTVAQLSEELIVITSPIDVARAVERTILRWLPCRQVELSLASEVDPNAAPPEEPAAAPLRLPVEFGGATLGSLRVGEKAGGALFTHDDLDLLRTIANQGALALAHAYAYQELEVQRRQQAAAWRGERAALVETMAAEIAHEIRYPINFFRSVFDHCQKGRPLDSEDVEIGREEVDRLERLVSGLRRMVQSHRLERRQVRVLELCDRVETLMRDSLGGRPLEFAIPPDAALLCDPDQVIQVLVNLVANAVDAAGAGSIGIAWSHEHAGAELLVWDTGPGFGADAAKLFAPGYTTRPSGTGLGLAITHRLIRAHGWSIEAQRRNKFTQFVISIPKQDLIVPFGEAASAGAA